MDAILLQELSFKDELLSLEELEASLGRLKLVANVKCPRCTAIIIHCRWMGSIRWIASSQHALWVGVRAEEEFTFCSAHLPSWVSDDCFEQSVEEVLEAGRCKASGSIFLGVDANCNIDDSNDQQDVLVQELCAVHNLLLLFQRFWTLAWQSPTGSMTKKKKVDFFFTNQSSSRSAFRGHMCQVLCSSSKGKRSHWRDGHHKRRHNIMSYTAHSPSTCLWGPRSGKFNKLLRR